MMLCGAVWDGGRVDWKRWAFSILRYNLKSIYTVTKLLEDRVNMDG